MLYKEFTDDIYPKQPLLHVRKTVRAIAKREDGKIGFLHLVGEDLFRVRDHLETPGGGMEEGESFEDTLRREIKEEFGYCVKDFEMIGTVVDEYNLIQRKTISQFFVCSLDTSVCETERTEMEKELVKEVVWLNEKDALTLLEEHQIGPCGKIVQRRDGYVLRYYLKHKDQFLIK